MSILKYKHLEYGIQVPQERNPLVMEHRFRRKQETRKMRVQIEGSSTKHCIKKLKKEQVLQGHMK